MASATTEGGLTMAKYINRDAYIRYLSSRKAEFVDDFGQGWCAGIDTAISACEKFPAADVEPVRHAHWNYRCPIDGNSYRYCSKCLSAVYDSVLYVSKNYCPNCGAKMDRSSNEE